MSFRTLPVMTPDQRHLRCGIWDLAPGAERRGICLLLNGHAEFLEKYEEVAQELLARGFDVVSFDWRGQGASERRRCNAGAGHVGSFDEYDADLAAVLLQGVEALQRTLPSPVRVIAFGHSMGAHVLLRFLRNHKRRFLCAILSAPMISAQLGRFPRVLATLIAMIFNLREPSSRFVFGVADRDPIELNFEDNVVTSDRARFERTKALLRGKRYLRIHGPTFGWLGAALSSQRQLARKRFAAGIAMPLLVFGAGRDRVVDVDAVREFAERVPGARYVEIKESEHEILMENDSIRTRFWAEFDTFVEAQLSDKKGW